MSQKYPGGFVTKSPTIPNGATAPGIWTLEQAAYYTKQGLWPTPTVPDPYFYDVTLLLNGNGTNGAQNNTFIDSSTHAYTISRTGNATQGSFSPYGNLWGNYFLGSASSRLQFPSGNILPASSNFTLECWICPNKPTNGSYGGIVAQGTLPYSDNGRTALGILNSGVITYGIGESFPSFTSGSAVPFGQWTHVAITRNGNTFTMYINGTQVNQVSSTKAIDSGYFRIGTIWDGDGGGLNPYDGFVSNLRVTYDVVYSSNFTPSTTPLTAIANTQVLTCQSNKFVDNSSNNYAITLNGTPSVQRFSPFNPTTTYSTSTLGGSMFTDTNSYISYTQATYSGSVTMEGWVYLKPGGSGSAPMFGNSSGNYSVYVYQPENCIIWYIYYPQGTNGIRFNLTSTFGVRYGEWMYVAFVRNGTSIKLYLNGIDASTVSGVGIQGSTTNSLTMYNDIMGSYTSGSGNAGDAYYCDLRASASAAYTTNFTPPTAPIGNIGGTNILCNFTNAGVPDLAMQNDLQTVGSAQVSTSVKKYGTGSLYFGGSTSNQILTYQNTGLFDFTKPMTIECWLYTPDVTTYAGIVQLYGGTQSWSTGSGVEYQFAFYNGSLYWQWNNGGGTNSLSSSSGISTNTWIYATVTFDGTTTRLFINGNLVGTSTNSYTMPSTRNIFQVGNNGTTNGLNGYIDDLRVTSGIARYTSSFTPPTAALPTYGG